MGFFTEQSTITKITTTRTKITFNTK